MKTRVRWEYGFLPFRGGCPYVNGLDQAQNDLWRDSLRLPRYDPGQDRSHPDYSAGYQEGLRRGPSSCNVSMFIPPTFIAKKHYA